MDSLRIHGKAAAADLVERNFDHDPKYLNMRIGMNSRLDTLQAAILIEKLKVFPGEILARQTAADRYAEGLGEVVKTPTVIAGGRSVWAQYTIEVDEPDALGAHLKAAGVPTARYYPIPMHAQRPYREFPAPGGLPATEAAAKRVISLPMHADMTADTQDKIIRAVRSFNG
jgi:dTDP-4-amino-4,6-dideoxygalactose transaminase